MKLKYLALAVAFVSFGAQAQTKLTSEAQKVGYTIGSDMGVKLAEMNKEDKGAIDFDSVIAGLKESYEGKKLALTPEEMDKIMEEFGKRQMERLKKEYDKLKTENLKKGEEFLKENAKKDGVKTTKSGLQYKELKKGNGKKINADSVVTVTYEGKLLDGTVFDSSKNSPEPITFSLTEVIPGWTEGLQLMEEGSQYELYIPADLAYGEQGAGATIPPNSTLIFDITVDKVQEAKNDGVKDKVKQVASDVSSAVNNAVEDVKKGLETDAKKDDKKGDKK